MRDRPPVGWNWIDFDMPIILTQLAISLSDSTIHICHCDTQNGSIALLFAIHISRFVKQEMYKREIFSFVCFPFDKAHLSLQISVCVGFTSNNPKQHSTTKKKTNK